MVFSNLFAWIRLLGSLWIGSLLTGITLLSAAPIGTTYPVGRGPDGVTVGDFNGDGILDLAVVNLVSNNLVVLLGQPDGTYVPSIDIGVGLSPAGLVTGTFDHSERSHLAIASSGGFFIAVLLNDGQGNFSTQERAQFIVVGNTPYGVWTGDFNNDGHLDLLIPNSGENTLTLLSGMGNGFFDDKKPLRLPTGSIPVSALGADFNGDGLLDLAYANFGSRYVDVRLNLGNGRFAEDVRSFPVGDGPRALAVADLNGDGLADLVVANQRGHSISVLLGQGNGDFLPAQTVTMGRSPRALVVADFDDDGHPDVALVDQDTDTLTLLLGMGDGTFADPINLPVGREPLALAAADLNGDGLPDLVVANSGSNSVTVLINNGDGTFR